MGRKDNHLEKYRVVQYGEWPRKDPNACRNARYFNDANKAMTAYMTSCLNQLSGLAKSARVTLERRNCIAGHEDYVVCFESKNGFLMVIE